MMKSQKEKIYRFKNKQTGEVITTPYQADAEEYRNNDNYIEVNMSKPVYTKEMHERGELPPVGSEFAFPHFEGGEHRCSDFSELTCQVIGHATSLNGKSVITFNHIVKGVGALGFTKDYFLPITAIEDDVFRVINDNIPAGWNFNRELAAKLLVKFNITPKES